MQTIRELPRDVQDALLRCLDRDGCPAKVGRIVALLTEHAPRLAFYGNSDEAFDGLHDLWLSRRLAAAALSN